MILNANTISETDRIFEISDCFVESGHVVQPYSTWEVTLYLAPKTDYVLISAASGTVIKDSSSPSVTDIAVNQITDHVYEVANWYSGWQRVIIHVRNNNSYAAAYAISYLLFKRLEMT